MDCADFQYPGDDRPWQPDLLWLRKFEQALETAEAVTFDVFDTALTRWLDAPVDVFALIEQRLTEEHGPIFTGYATKRETAEKDARQKASDIGLREVTFCDILNALVTAWPDLEPWYETLKEAEYAAELDCCFGVPEILRATELCAQKKIPVLFVSDMYLPENFIRTLLENAGYSVPGLLVSCENECAKWDGSQWPEVRKKLGRKTRILHIGDNSISDGKTARDAGLHTLLFTRARSNARQGGPLTPDILPFSRLLRAEMLLGPLEPGLMDPTSQPAQRVMALLGASWGAIVVGCYVRWIADRASALGLRHLYFCARDGFLPQKVWNAAGLGKKTGIESSYLYISRRALNFAAVVASCKTDRALSDHALNVLCAVFRAETVGNILERDGLLGVKPLVEDVLKEFGSLKREITAHDGAAILRKCMQRNAAPILKALRKRLDIARDYLVQEGFAAGRVGLVDIGWHGNMQAAISEILSYSDIAPDVSGLYLGLWPGAQPNRVRCGWMEAALWNDYMPFSKAYGLLNAIAILENTFSFRDGTTLGYEKRNGRVTAVIGECENSLQQYETLLSPFQDAVAEAAGRLLGGETVSTVTASDLTPEHALAAVSRLSLSPSPSEIAAIGSISHSGDPSHARLVQLVQELSGDAPEDDHIVLHHSDWSAASALTVLRRSRTPEQRRRLAENIRHQCHNYDSRTLSQFS